MDPVLAYIAFWSEPDPDRRRVLLESCWTERSEIVGPGYRFTGVSEVLAEAARFQREQPGFSAIATSGCDRHGRWVRFTIAMVDAAGRKVIEGWDVVELLPDGRIARVITFWGALPGAAVAP